MMLEPIEEATTLLYIELISLDRRILDMLDNVGTLSSVLDKGENLLAQGYTVRTSKYKQQKDTRSENKRKIKRFRSDMKSSDFKTIGDRVFYGPYAKRIEHANKQI